MKFIQIFLLIIIAIGLVALALQKLWVPKVVAYILSREASPTMAVPRQQPIVLTDGRQCYTYSHDATAAAPYTVQEVLDITIVGTTVTGTKSGTQSGPDMTNGYSGTFVGTLAGNTITGVFSYTVDGAKNKEQEIYRTTLTGLEKLRYPLVEKEGILVPDQTQSPTPLLYARVECGGSG
ncbi:MAG TPA: hypothetical protein VG621_03300 [Candidatus Paceibacterota bacterium]|nr:hypothetical protein [Candidatus Paceibacterota bacterium]